MNILKLLDVIEWSIEDAKQHDDGLAAVRGFTVYRDVILYLVSEGKIELTDNRSKFDRYIKTFTVSALYKVAEHYRKTNNMPPLLYTQPIYYMKEQKHADYH